MTPTQPTSENADEGAEVLPPVDERALRRVVLACAVLDDIDLELFGDGVVVRGGPGTEVSWDALRATLGEVDPEGTVARVRVLAHLRGARACADLGPDLLRARLRPRGLPVGHALHPGTGWTRSRVLGGALLLGPGFLGTSGDPDRVELIPPRVLADAGIDLAGTWTGALGYLERMGALAADRLAHTRSVLRPMGDCDVVTLLGAASFRRGLVATERLGMLAVAVPMRTRGWIDLSRIDPAFVSAAAAATEDVDRGFARPVLVTAEEVALAAPGGSAVIPLRDNALPDPVLPAMRWR